MNLKGNFNRILRNNQQYFLFFIQTITNKEPFAEWTYQFPRLKKLKTNHKYQVEVTVSREYVVIPIPITSGRLDIEVTGKLDDLNNIFCLYQSHWFTFF